MKVDFFSKKGKRKVNEDYILSKIIDENISLHIVADGMGGYENGKLAAQTVAESICTFVSRNFNNSNYTDIINNAVEKANVDVARLIEEHNAKMGTTIGGVLIVKKSAYQFWVGDVRIIHLRNDKILFESVDHSLINQLKKNKLTIEKVDYGKIRHIVTKSIQGTTDRFKPDFHTVKMQVKDKILICSDGILDKVDINSLCNIEFDSLKKYSELFEDGRDNASLMLISF